MKRIVSLILVLGMLLCGAALAEDVRETAGTEYFVSDQPVTIKMVFVESGPNNTRNDMWLFKMYEKYTNVTVDVERISGEAWTERKSLMFAADEQPEIIVNGSFTQAELAQYVDAGQLLKVTDLVEQYMPHYLAYLSRFDKYERAKLYMDGEMVGLIGNAGDGIITIPGARAIINQAWLDKLNIPTPKTWDEFYAALVAFRDGDPNGNGIQDEIPLCGYSSYRVDALVTSDLGICVGWSKMSEWYEGDDGSLQYVYTSDRYHEYLRRMRQLYEEKLLDNEYFTQESGQVVAKGAGDLIGACTYAAPFVLCNNNADVYEQFEAFKPLTGEYYSEGRHYANMLGSPNVYFTNKNQHLVESAKWFDFLYTELNGILQQGPEKGSEIVGDWDGRGGWYWVDDEHTGWLVDVPEQYAGHHEWKLAEVAPFTVRGSASSSDFFSKSILLPGDEHLVNIFKPIWEYIVPVFPQTYSLTADESDEIALIKAELDSYISQMETKFIIGELDLEENWDAFKDHLINSIGVEDYIRVNQTAYSRFLEGIEKMDE